MEKQHVCPWWLGYFLISPLRKYMQNPEKILEPYIKPGMKVIDYGSAMGFFSLPMAKLVGLDGKVFCFDIQKKMLDKLVSRAKNAKVATIIEPHLIRGDESEFDHLREAADFGLLFAVVHEVPDRQALFTLLNGMMKNKARLLIAEPTGHVTSSSFEESVSIAEKCGFKRIEQLKISKSHSVLLEKI